MRSLSHGNTTGGQRSVRYGGEGGVVVPIGERKVRGSWALVCLLFSIRIFDFHESPDSVRARKKPKSTPISSKSSSTEGRAIGFGEVSKRLKAAFS